MRSVGLELRDLFPNEMFKMERKPRGPTSPKEIRDALRKRYDELVEEGAPQTTATVNAARRSISIRFGLKLAPLATRLHEGYAHDADPLWPALFRYAADHALRAFGSTLTCDDRERLGLELPVRVRIAAEEAAARELRRIGQEKKAVAVG